MNPISVQVPPDGEIDCSPSYLFDYSDLYKENAREAGLQWFHDAAFGLGVHFGLYSLLGKGERALADGVLTPEDYKRLATKLEATHFDAMDIVEFTIANGMRYVNFSVRTADGFSLFNTKLSDYNYTKSPAKRDFLGELASCCEYHGIGLCLNYSHGRDWSRPEGYPNAPVKDVEMGRQIAYQEFMLGQLEELLTQYGPIAAICLDGIDVPQSSPALKEFGCQDLYDFVHHLQPQVLLSYNQGLLGTEDFFSCVDNLPAEDAEDAIKGFVHAQSDKPVEIRISLTPEAWGYHAERAGKHLRVEQVWAELAKARAAQCNLLVNTALMPDGSLDLEDIQTLLEVGKRIEEHGYPNS